MIGIVAADVFHVAEIDDDVARRRRAIPRGSSWWRRDDEMAVGKNGEVVVRSNHGDIAFGAGGAQRARCSVALPSSAR